MLVPAVLNNNPIIFSGQSKGTEFRINKLTENSVYRFRVCAHTLDGQGQWATLDKDITATDPYGSYFLISIISFRGQVDSRWF